MGAVHFECRNRVGYVTLQSGSMNPLDRAMVTRLGEVLAASAADDEVRALLLRGAGERAFSVGSDLSELRGLVSQGLEALAAKFMQDDAVFGALARFPKPTVAAIEGAAVGGGLELAACCDLIVCARGAKLSLPEVRLGVFPGSGGTVRVTRRIGPGRASRMMLLGDPVDAATAQAWGLVDELCDDGTAVAAASELAVRLAAGPRRGMQACKASLRAALDETEEAALALATRWAVDLGVSEDLAEGLRAIDEKRRPVFR